MKNCHFLILKVIKHSFHQKSEYCWPRKCSLRRNTTIQKNISRFSTGNILITEYILAHKNQCWKKIFSIHTSCMEPLVTTWQWRHKYHQFDAIHTDMGYFQSSSTQGEVKIIDIKICCSISDGSILHPEYKLKWGIPARFWDIGHTPVVWSYASF